MFTIWTALPANFVTRGEYKTFTLILKNSSCFFPSSWKRKVWFSLFDLSAQDLQIATGGQVVLSAN